ncbi:MAG: CsbD family protein [Bdellovibrionales bacterium]|nr:CsbD family protein [Bdellovibrionales bacterium]
MNTSIVEGSLKELKGDLKQTWSKLTEDDLNYIDGGVESIIGKVQKAYGFTKERASEEFDKFKTQHTDYFRDERDLIKNTKEKTMATASQLNGQYDVNKIKKQASHMIEDDIVEPGKEYLERAREMSAQLVYRTTGLVKENPTYAILGAATVGFLAGAYFFRRK